MTLITAIQTTTTTIIMDQNIISLRMHTTFTGLDLGGIGAFSFIMRIVTGIITIAITVIGVEMNTEDKELGEVTRELLDNREILNKAQDSLALQDKPSKAQDNLDLEGNDSLDQRDKPSKAHDSLDLEGNANQGADHSGNLAAADMATMGAENTKQYLTTKKQHEPMKKIAILIAAVCSNILHASSCSTQVHQEDQQNEPEYDYYYYSGPEYYFDENANDIYWFGPGWYWGVFFYNENNYWDYHHTHHNHWRANEHRGQRTWRSNTGATRQMRSGGQTQQNARQSGATRQSSSGGQQSTRQSGSARQTQQRTGQSSSGSQQGTRQSGSGRQAQQSTGQSNSGAQQSTRQSGSTKQTQQNTKQSGGDRTKDQGAGKH